MISIKKSNFIQSSKFEIRNFHPKIDQNLENFHFIINLINFLIISNRIFTFSSEILNVISATASSLEWSKIKIMKSFYLICIIFIIEISKKCVFLQWRNSFIPYERFSVFIG